MTKEDWVDKNSDIDDKEDHQHIRLYTRIYTGQSIGYANWKLKHPQFKISTIQKYCKL